MSARWWSFLVWALVAAAATFWGLRLFVQAPAAPPQTRTAQAAPAARGALTLLLGADPPPPATVATTEPAPDTRFQLLGVVSPPPSAAREGVALIAVDGKPAKAYRVGALVEGQNVLQSVGARGATLGPRGGAALVALHIAPLPPAATSVLPPGGAAFAPPDGAAQPQAPRPSAPFQPPIRPAYAPPMGAPKLPPQPNQLPANPAQDNAALR